MMNDLKQWKCPKGHVLGVVERVKSDNCKGQSIHVRRLMLYRHAVDLTQTTLADVDVIGALEGTMINIRCDVPGCGAVRIWVMGEDAIERLIEIIKGDNVHDH
jgi:hypothetical protein